MNYPIVLYRSNENSFQTTWDFWYNQHLTFSCRRLININFWQKRKRMVRQPKDYLPFSAPLTLVSGSKGKRLLPVPFRIFSILYTKTKSLCRSLCRMLTVKWLTNSIRYAHQTILIWNGFLQFNTPTRTHIFSFCQRFCSIVIRLLHTSFLMNIRCLTVVSDFP